MRNLFYELTVMALLLACTSEKKEKVDIERETTRIVKILDRFHDAENTKDTLGLIGLLHEKALVLGHNYNNRQDDMWDKEQFRKYASHWFPTADSKPPKLIQVESRTVRILEDGETAMAIEHFQMDRLRLITRHVAVLTKRDTTWLLSLSSYDFAPFDSQMPKIWKSVEETAIPNTLTGK